jgi:replication-associated recombination protein RarA
MSENQHKPKTQKAYSGGFELRLIDGYEFDEVASALQKSIRRNEEYNACFWLYVLHQSGYYKYAWKRLMVIASEDIGNGEPMATVVVNSLWQNYTFCIDSKKRNSGDALLFLFHAAMYLCRSEKLREADTLVNLLTKRYAAGERLEIPDYAIDPHTDRGKQIHGRWDTGTPEEHAERSRKWFEIWSIVSPKSKLPDKYLKRMMEMDGLTK